MRRVFLSAVMVLVCAWGYAQDLPKVVPPSPNIAALNKYLDAPVSHATGIPSINVPIYAINNGDISLPVNLSYHAGGVKVEEIASWVGLGWSLNSGGVISRMSKGLPDDHPKGYMYADKKVQELRNLKGVSWMSFYNELVMANNLAKDYQPDIFSFNFGNYSGKFFYNQTTNEFVQTPYSNIDVKYQKGSDGKTIIRWIFTTPNGVKYYFGKSKNNTREGIDKNNGNHTFSYDGQNTSSLPSSGVAMPTHITAWYLMDIVSVKGKEINLTYKKTLGINTLNRTGETYIPSHQCGSKPTRYNISFSQSLLDQTIISKIEFDTGKIEFIEDTVGRLDLTGSTKLKEVKLYDSNNSLIKTTRLHYDYTISPVETGKWVNVGNATQRRYRLRLTSVEEQGKDGSKKPPYQFIYNTTLLPSRLSNAQDYWGYYNGIEDNYGLIPEIRFKKNIYVGNANRTTDPIKSQAGILTKVIYPTGGSASYFYENNTASIVISKIDKHYNLRNRLVNKSVSFIKSPVNIDNSGQNTYAKNFTITNGLGRASITTSVTGCSNPTILSDLGCDYMLTIKGITDPTFEMTISSPSFKTELPSGVYKLVALETGGGGSSGGLVGSGSTSNSSTFSLTINWGEDPHPEYLTVGGLRVSKTVLTDINGKTIEKRYNYNQFNQNITSGYAISSPSFLVNIVDSSCSPISEVTKIASYSQFSMSLIKGNILGYSNVTELNVDNSKTEYSFNSPGAFPHYQATNEEILPDLYTGWLRGNLIKKEDFSIEGSNYQKRRTLVNQYDRVTTNKFSNVGIAMLPWISNLNETFSFGFYSSISEWYRLKNTVTTDYFSTGNITTTQNYVYNNNPLLASETNSTNSQGVLLKTKTYYPDDIVNVSSLGHDNLTTTEKSAIDQLKKGAQHRISETVQVETYKNNVLQSTQRTNYKNFNGLYLPQIVQSSKVNLALEDRVVFHQYDTKGNPVEVSKKDGTKIYYVWGYNQTQPIAKIEAYEGVISSAQQTAINNAVTASNADTNVATENALRTSLATLRASFTNIQTQVTTFTYNPLIGVTSVTDPRGRTMYYEYDNFNRLKLVKDAEGNILKENTYHYKN
ncbi:RHS repeat domain-containing protein [Tenacibaculum halocynthiae]|uniref:hypothetical protein n=1 Tax=Tenacibaculum halocynthiae TaxID=1254437 RepID=UPI0038951EF5